MALLIITRIASRAVTLDKFIGATAANVLLGRGSAGGAGNFEEITLGSGLSLAGTVLSASMSGSPFANQGLKVLDTNDSHSLVIAPGSDLTAERILSLVTGDAARTITLTGNPTLNDWFDQAVKAASSPTFATLNLSGGQIVFPAVQNPSAGANTLDDYEEGTWTPVIGGTGGESGQTYSLQTGTYVKVGELVTASFNVKLSAKGTITGDVVLKGLPFTPRAGVPTAGLSMHWEDTATSYVYLVALIAASVAYGFIRGATAAATNSDATLATANVGNTTAFKGIYIYAA